MRVRFSRLRPNGSRTLHVWPGGVSRRVSGGDIISCMCMIVTGPIAETHRDRFRAGWFSIAKKAVARFDPILRNNESVLAEMGASNHEIGQYCGGGLSHCSHITDQYSISFSLKSIGRYTTVQCPSCIRISGESQI